MAMEVREERMNSLFVYPGGVECMDPLTIDSVEDVKPVVACRGCLATDQPLRPLDHKLAATYGIFISSVQDSDIYPKYICMYCRVLLLRFTSFREKCISVQTALTNIHSTGTPITFSLIKSGIVKSMFPLRTTQIKTINLNPTDDYKTPKCGTNNEIMINEHKNEENYLEIELKESEEISDKNNIDVKFVPNDEVYFDERNAESSLYSSNTDLCRNDDLKQERVKSKRKHYQKIKVNKTDRKTTKQLPENDIKIIDESSVENDDLISINADDINSYVSDDADVDYKILVNQKRPAKKKIRKDKLSKRIKYQVAERDKKHGIVQPNTEVIKEIIDEVEKHSSNDEVSNKTDSPLLQVEKPAKSFKINTKEKATVRQQRKLFMKKESDFENKLNVKMILLSKEDQIKQMEERKDSSNYKRAKYKCELCYRIYNLNTTYKNHMAKHTSIEGQALCEICNLSFAKSKLQAHVTNYHKYNYICNQCGHVSKSPDVAKIHFKWHSGVQYDCKVCGKAFDKPSSVMGHMHLAHGGNTKCPICDKKCIGDRGLKSHMQKSHKEAIGAVCASCGVQFHSVSAMQRHRPQGDCDHTHRPCAACGESFSSDVLFKQHQSQCQILQSVLNYRCEICGKSFDDKARYFAHHHYNNKQRQPRSTNISTGRQGQTVVTFMCEMCGCIKNSKNSLDYHVRSTHSNVKPFQCDYCGKGFSDKRNLQIHISKHMSTDCRVTFSCSFCHKQFTYDSNRQRHEYAVHHRRRPHKCHICEKTFQDSTSMKAHIKHTHEGVPWPKRVRNRR